MLFISLIFILSLILTAFFLPQPAQAVVDPLASPNNKFGIHIIGATLEEASPAADLVNSSGGDWGYITVLVESKNRDQKRWQIFFDYLRRRHLIPLVRLATEPQGPPTGPANGAGGWKLPYEGEEIAWADFLDNLVWPTKNRYIIIYNEPNQGQEWAGRVDAKSYAQVLDKTVSVLKAKNPDFFVLNAGFDASCPNKPPLFQDELSFLRQMNEEVPGIFEKLDGWVSHSYPNPDFAGSPNGSGRGTVRTWAWELEELKKLGVVKNLPVFISETGWKHAEGLQFDKSLPVSEVVGEYLKEAFQNAWDDEKILAVTPFLLNYQESPFDHFSFKKLTGEKQNLKILGASFPDYYPPYQIIMDLPKLSGRPVQENKAKLSKGSIYSVVVTSETYTIPLTFKNTGQSIWNEYEKVELRVLTGQEELEIQSVSLSAKIEPGQEAAFIVQLKAPHFGNFKTTLQFFSGNKPFDQRPLEFNLEAKSPVILQIHAGLLWKRNFAGEYLLKVASEVVETTTGVILNSHGRSKEMEARYLLPNYTFDFTLYKLFYKSKTLQIKVDSGINYLDFGKLEPDFLSALLKPKEFWKLLPF